MRLRLSPVLGVLVALSWVAASAQVAPPRQGQGRDTPGAVAVPATGVIAGRITLAGSGQPVQDARVTLSAPELRGTRSAVTDEEGQYTFSELPVGNFTIRATMTGYTAGTFGQRSPGKPGTTIVLGAGQQRRDISFEMAKGGVISGLVLDEKNRPSISTPVRVMRWVMQSGERTLTSAGSGTTDDRGLYRVFNLMPGEYLVSAVPRNQTNTVTVDQVQRVDGQVQLSATISGMPAEINPAQGYAPVYFPGTPDLIAARSVRLGIAEEQLGIDITLHRVGLSTISGQVVTPSGQNPTNVQVRLVRSEGTATGVGQVSVRPSQNGSFTFRSVVPGQYTVFATVTAATPQLPGLLPGQQAPQRRLWALADVFVDGHYPPVVHLTMQEGLPVSGHFQFDGTAPLPQGNQRIRVTMNPIGQPLQSAGLGNLTTTADANGRFTMPGVVPGRYRVSASGASGWQVKQVIVNGIDVLDFPFVVGGDGAVPDVTIRFGDRHTELRGRLTDPSGAPTAEHSVVIFADEPRYWIPHARRMRAVRPNTEGAFTFTGLPPGDYRLAAVTDVDTGEWLDPEFLRQLVPASIGVRLVDGAPTTQDIRVR